MSITKTEIFIASRFDEFANIRSALKERINLFPVFPIEAVDLNDNISSSAPPIGKCLAAVKRAEVMVLLVGETYGGSPQGESLSYTHLEYRAAVEEDTQTVVLPFFIGASYRSKLSTPSTDPKLAAWQEEIIKNHTPAFFDGTIEAKELSQLIFDNILKTLYEVRDAAIRHQMDLLAVSADADYVVESDGNDAEELELALSQNELDQLDARTQSGDDQNFGEDVDDIKDLAELLKRPAEVAAIEQKREAHKAMELGDRFVAIKHFRKALELRPLDLKAAYWLARLLTTSGMNRDFREAIRLALHACKMGGYDDRPVIVASSYMVAARAAAKLNETAEAIEYAKKAVEVTPWLAAAHAELACHFASNNQLEQAFISVRQAFKIKPEIILVLNRESAFAAHAKAYSEFKRQLRQELQNSVKQLLDAQRTALKTLSQTRLEEEVLSSIDKKLNSLQARPLINLLYDARQTTKTFLQNLQTECSYLQGEGSHHRRTYSAKQQKATVVENKKKYLGVAIVGAVFAVIALMLHIKFFVAVGICVATVFGTLFVANASKIAAVENNLSSIHEDIRDSIARLCDAIAIYEKAVSAAGFGKWSSIRNAKAGNIVRVDLTLQGDALQQVEIDDNIVPPDLRHFIDESKNLCNNRIRFYRACNNARGKLYFTRYGVYFEAVDA